jgi:hypothetical protein
LPSKNPNSVNQSRPQMASQPKVQQVWIYD